LRNGDIKSDKTIDISRIHKEFQTMKQVTTLPGELLKIFPRYEFEKLEKQHQSNHYTKYYTGWQQLITLFYAQIGGHDSLRGIQTSLALAREMADTPLPGRSSGMPPETESATDRGMLRHR